MPLPAWKCGQAVCASLCAFGNILNSLLEAPRSTKTDHKKAPSGKDAFPDGAFCVIRRRTLSLRRGPLSGMDKKRKPEPDLSLAAPAVSMAGAADREIAGEPARKDVNRRERGAGGAPCQSDLKKAVSVRFPWASPSKIRSSKPAAAGPDWLECHCNASLHKVFFIIHSGLSDIQSRRDNSCRTAGLSAPASGRAGLFPVPKVRCKPYNTSFLFAALFSPGWVFYQHMRGKAGFSCFF